MKRFLNKTKKGFTIVELVIVIGVIGILSAILIPTFVNLNSKASDAALKSDLAAVYSSYIADAADGYVGETKETKLEMYGQQEVYLRKETTEAGKYYEYGTDGWKTELTAHDIHEKADYTLTRLGDDANPKLEYSGYQVWAFVKNSTTPSPLF